MTNQGYVVNDQLAADSTAKTVHPHSLVPCSFCGEFLEIHRWSDTKNVLKCGNWQHNCPRRDQPQHYVDANNKRVKRGKG
jgi:hypothetical protein